MVVGLEESQLEIKGVGRQPPRCDGNLDGVRFSRVRGSVGWGEGSRTKERVVVGQEPSSSGKLPEGQEEKGWGGS